MKVHLTRTTIFPSAELSRVCDLLFNHQGPLNFRMATKPILFEVQDFGWGELFSEMASFRKNNGISDDEYVVCITELRNSSNWFSAAGLKPYRDVRSTACVL